MNEIYRSWFCRLIFIIWELFLSLASLLRVLFGLYCAFVFVSSVCLKGEFFFLGLTKQQQQHQAPTATTIIICNNNESNNNNVRKNNKNRNTIIFRYYLLGGCTLRLFFRFSLVRLNTCVLFCCFYYYFSFIYDYFSLIFKFFYFGFC